MTNRERWIIYPLLFLSIGLAMRSGIIQSEQEKQIETGIIQCNIIQCKAMQVVDSNDKPRVIIEAGGKAGDGLLRIASAKGKSLAILNASDTGSTLSLLDNESKTVLVLDNEGSPRIFAGIFDQSGNIKQPRDVRFPGSLAPSREVVPARRDPEKKTPSTNRDAKESEK